jgi:ribosomal protein S18 acetylase RimI-like enzyme
VAGSADDVAWRIDEACMNACPAPRRALLGPWELRSGGGSIRRINSVNPLGPADHDPRPILGAVEAFYARIGQPARFRVPSMAHGLDGPLEAAGYTIEGRSLTLLAEDAPPAVDTTRVELTEQASPEWLETWRRISGRPEADAPIFPLILANIAPPARFAIVRAQGAAASIAYAVIHASLVVVEAVVTDPAYRGQGLARRSVGSLMAWGRSAGATAACLNVEHGNEPAQALYRSLGFAREISTYHYRRAPKSFLP